MSHKINKREAIDFVEELSKALLKYKHSYADVLVRDLNKESRLQSRADFYLSNDDFAINISVYKK